MWMETGGGGKESTPTTSSNNQNNDGGGDSDVEETVLSNMKDITVVVVASSPASSVDDVEQSLMSLEDTIPGPHVHHHSEEHADKTTSVERPSLVTHSATDTPASPDPENLGPPDPEQMVEPDELPVEEAAPPPPPPVPPPPAAPPLLSPPIPPPVPPPVLPPEPPLPYPTVTRMPQVSFEPPEEMMEPEKEKNPESPPLLKKEEGVRRSVDMRQNVLLKQLLQNSACSPSSGPVAVPSLEAQLARPVPPTHSRLIPTLVNDRPPPMLRLPGVQQPSARPPTAPKPDTKQRDLMSHIPSQQRTPPPQPPVPPPAAPEEKPSGPPTPQQQLLQQTQAIQQILQAQIIKSEAIAAPTPPPPPPTPPAPTPPPPPVVAPPPAEKQIVVQQPVMQQQQVAPPPPAPKMPELPPAAAPVAAPPPEPKTPTTPTTPTPQQQQQQQHHHHLQQQHQQAPLMQIKREMDETSQTSTQNSRDNAMDVDNNSCDTVLPSAECSAADLKKLKRRQYQQKRRQSAGKEGGPTPKKRSRKLSSTSQSSCKVEEDYDTFIEHLMPQLRQLPSLGVLEPELGRNLAVCPVFGSGELNKVGVAPLIGCTAGQYGELTGSMGTARIPNASQFYNTKPFGPETAVPPVPTASSQRGFYDQEFAPLKLEPDDSNRERDDSPDTVVSSSSPECFFSEIPHRFPGLRLIKDKQAADEKAKRASPVIPLVAPTPVRVRPNITLKDVLELDKENQGTSAGLFMRHRWGGCPSMPLRQMENVTVTLTLSTTAARDVERAISGLARLLSLPTPLQYSVADTTTMPDVKLGLLQTRRRDGKEGDAIDIQSLLNGAFKFCQQCQLCVLDNFISKWVSDLPSLPVDLTVADKLHFCSDDCFSQFSRAKGIERVPVKDAVTGAGAVLKKLKPPIKEKVPEPVAPLPVALPKSLKGVRYKSWTPGLQPPNKYKKPSDRELTDLLFRTGVTLMPAKLPDDTRQCMFCHQLGDGPGDGAGRLLNYDVDKWVHLNCALWSDDVYETENGALMNLEQALQLSLAQTCSVCEKHGATVKCFKLRCGSTYHLGCAVKDDCVFFKNKSVYCSAHIPKGEKESELATLAVFRRVYVNRDENRQVAAVMHYSDQSHLLRVGSLIFLNVGQLLPHQLPNFHTQNFIYPIGYKIARIYWSMRLFNKRCRYICSIHDNAGRPEFRVLVQEAGHPDLELRASSARSVWLQILEPMLSVRRAADGVQVFHKFISGEDLFGLTEPAIIRVLESLPGIESLADYKFKYGRNPLLELPLAVNPTGCARSEPKLRTHFKRPHTQRTGSVSSRPALVPAASSSHGETACPYSKQFVHSKSSQYKKMKLEWRNNVFLARSKIQGLGLYAARDMEKHTMVIEYIGEMIRTELAEAREKQYEEKNRGIYMFRLDEERVIDATLSGGLARYINHSCNPNCVAETVEVDRDFRIIIFAKRRINRGEELAYDYKFDIEDDQHKISCLCEAPNCKKWMN